MAQERELVIPAGQRQLFLDDYAVLCIENLTRTMHRPSKKGAVIRPDLTIGGAPEIRTGPAWDPQEQRFKLWTLTSVEGGVISCSGVHESPDGIHWTQPAVRQVAYRGSLENHYVCYPFEKGETLGPHSVVYDPHDPDPSRRYKTLSYYFPRHILVLATSPDGIRWARLDAPPIPSFDEFNLSFDGAHRQFLATVKVNGPYGRSHALTTSQDFENWTEPELIFHADELDQTLARKVIPEHLANPTLQQPVCHDPADYGADIYNFPVSRYGGLYIGFPAVFYHAGLNPSGRNYDGFHHVQLACSRDMRSWERLGNREAFIDPSPLGAGAYDTMQILPPSFPVVRGDELWFYYSGLKYRWLPQQTDRDRAAICLATLRRDGFISLDADEKGGLVTTRPFRWEGERLYINGAATGGQIACEFLDASGDPIPGFTRADCVPFTGDSARQTVSWVGQARLPSPSTGPIRLRVYLRRAKLFSFWFE